MLRWRIHSGTTVLATPVATISNITHSGTVVRAIHSGTIAIISHSGTTAAITHSGTTATITRSGTVVATIHSGTVAITTHSGTVVAAIHSGTVAITTHSGTVVATIHSGTTATITRSGTIVGIIRSGTVANITIYWITFNTSLHLKVFDMCLLVAPTALYNMLKCLMARVVQALQTCFKLTLQQVKITPKLRAKIVAENSKFGCLLTWFLQHNISAFMHKYRTNTPIKIENNK